VPPPLLRLSPPAPPPPLLREAEQKAVAAKDRVEELSQMSKSATAVALKNHKRALKELMALLAEHQGTLAGKLSALCSLLSRHLCLSHHLSLTFVSLLHALSHALSLLAAS
jgi:hypothetical protein